MKIDVEQAPIRNLNNSLDLGVIFNQYHTFQPHVSSLVSFRLHYLYLHSIAIASVHSLVKLILNY